MSLRRPAAALAAVASAAALVVPPATAGAAERAAFTPLASLCLSLAKQAQAADKSGNKILANLLGRVLIVLGCGGAAI